MSLEEIEDCGKVHGVSCTEGCRSGSGTGDVHAGDGAERVGTKATDGATRSFFFFALPSRQESLGASGAVLARNTSPDLAWLGQEMLCLEAAFDGDLLLCPRDGILLSCLGLSGIAGTAGF